MTGNVYMLEPKTLTGSKRNVTWTITFDRATRMWSWQVSVAMEPQVFSGEAKSEQDAHKMVKQQLDVFAP